MYGLSVGISRVGSSLPLPVYALISGLNAATVGIIALAAVRLAEKAITDRLTRALVYLGGIMGILYTALWYYPVLMIGAGITTTVWDMRWPHRIAVFCKQCVTKPVAAEKELVVDDVEIGNPETWTEDARSAHNQLTPPTSLNPRRESMHTESEIPPQSEFPTQPTGEFRKGQYIYARQYRH